MTFHFNHWMFKFIKGVDAITLPWGVYVAASEADTDPDTIRHELVHVRQRDEIGAIRFYIDYYCQFMRGLINFLDIDAAYRHISYEEEAYEKGAG